MSDISHGSIFVPNDICLVDGWLSWKLPPRTGPSNWVRCTDMTLAKFTRLQKESEILQFAQRYGVFGAKQLRQDSDRLPSELSLEPKVGRWCVSEACLMEDREPLWIWMFLIRQARAMIRVNAALKGRTHTSMPVVGDEEDWRAIVGPGEPFTDVLDAQFFLMRAVNRWLRIGGVRLGLDLMKLARNATEWRVVIECGDPGGYNLYGQLAYQLFLSIAGEDRLYACSGCGSPYIRLNKAPRAGQDNYCPDCGKMARVRATQRYRRKKNGSVGKTV
jgi:DNA-directed RNA polymerase subunit RPC12/RpoP